MKTLIRGARFIAIEILCSWEEKGLPVDQVMENQLSRQALADPRDRQLIQSLVYGVIRWRGYLDWLIGQFSRTPLAKIKNRTLQALRVGILQLLFLDRVPVSAAINETVQALKDMRQPKWITGFVNGILRSVDRNRRDITHPMDEKIGDTLPEAARLSHPDWLVSRWKSRYTTPAAYELCQLNNTEPALCLRVNTSLATPGALRQKLADAGLNVEAGKYSPLAIRLDDYHGSITALPGFTEGEFQVQDEAAQLVSLLMGPLKPGRIYLDGCAGLGGKTSHLAQMLPRGAGLFASEPHPGRIQKLRENLVRLRLDTTVTIVEGTLDSLLPESREKFSGVLIDAPCSGLGVIRRHPDIRWNRKPADLLRYQEIQLGLLDHAAQLVAPGGTLLYATCSTEPEENDEAVRQFLESHPGFSAANCRDVLPESAAALVDKQGFLRTLPGRDDLDGFFGARLVKLKSDNS